MAQVLFWQRFSNQKKVETLSFAYFLGGRVREKKCAKKNGRSWIHSFNSLFLRISARFFLVAFSSKKKRREAAFKMNCKFILNFDNVKIIKPRHQQQMKYLLLVSEINRTRPKERGRKNGRNCGNMTRTTARHSMRHSSPQSQSFCV